MAVTKEELTGFLKEIFGSGNIPVCEAQVQHELALKIKNNSSDAKIYLEYPAEAVEKGEKRRIYYDIAIERDNAYCVLELKYKTKEEKVNFDGNEHTLRNHGAQSLNRFDFLKDVERIENFPNNTGKKFGGGFAVMLTNDSKYWQYDGKGHFYEEFSLKDNTEQIKGAKKWKNMPDTETVGKRRKDGLELHNDYAVNWQDIGGGFRCLIFEITK